MTPRFSCIASIGNGCGLYPPGSASHQFAGALMNGKMLRSIKSHDVAIVCLNWAEDEPLSRTDKAGLLSYEDHTTRFFPPAPVMPRIGGLNSGDTGLADDNEEAIQEFSSASCQCFNILGTGDKDGCICFSIFGIFPVGKIAWWEKTFSFSRSDGTQPLAFRFVFVAGKLQIQEEDNLRPVPEFGQTQILVYVHSCHHCITPWGKPQPRHPGKRSTCLTAKPTHCQLLEEEDYRVLLHSGFSLCSRTSWRTGRWCRRPSGRSISFDRKNNYDLPTFNSSNRSLSSSVCVWSYILYEC
ncbi:uncharacterized protein LOC123448353 isoform X3 [Hordeum vulgare subsp. vulgare]|uniref:uncharacterized protein LOC123448353 isoform X3 n=1 Tax=Hordeum vulgare subsp. vulgare TaxID=112509 RepID=UPI001D1A4EAF|nr:uncharacterized protein LOC123448353 isoform X3 [Hordeum vulgare subsp. vulgare]